MKVNRYTVGGIVWIILWFGIYIASSSTWGRKLLVFLFYLKMAHKRWQAEISIYVFTISPKIPRGNCDIKGLGRFSVWIWLNIHWWCETLQFKPWGPQMKGFWFIISLWLMGAVKISLFSTYSVQFWRGGFLWEFWKGESGSCHRSFDSPIHSLLQCFNLNTQCESSFYIIVSILYNPSAMGSETKMQNNNY